MSNGMTEQLEDHPLRKELIHHPFFKEVRSSDLTREKVGVFLGQWWHPLHYFPQLPVPHHRRRAGAGDEDRDLQDPRSGARRGRSGAAPTSASTSRP